MLEQLHEEKNWKIGCNKCDRKGVFNSPDEARKQGWSILLYGSEPAVVCWECIEL